MEQQLVRETLTYTTRQITEVDKALSAEFNKLAFSVLARAHRVMKYGPPPERMIVMRSVLAAIAKLSAVDAKAEVEASRMEFLDALSQMTSSENALPTVKTLDLTALDQDDEAGDPEV